MLRQDQIEAIIAELKTERKRFIGNSRDFDLKNITPQQVSKVRALDEKIECLIHHRINVGSAYKRIIDPKVKDSSERSKIRSSDGKMKDKENWSRGVKLLKAQERKIRYKAASELGKNDRI